MCSVPLTPVSRTAFADCLRPGGAVTRVPSSSSSSPAAGPPLGLGAGGNPQSKGGSLRRVRFLVLGDRVVPDLSFVVGVVLLGRVHAARVRRRLGLTRGDLGRDETFPFQLLFCIEKATMNILSF